MWPFKKKQKIAGIFETSELRKAPTQNETVTVTVSVDCVFNSIVKDLSTLDPYLWKFKTAYLSDIYHIASHPLVKYTFHMKGFSNNTTNHITLIGFSINMFTDEQKKFLRKKFSEIYDKIQQKKLDDELAKEQRNLSKLFPNCIINKS